MSHYMLVDLDLMITTSSQKERERRCQHLDYQNHSHELIRELHIMGLRSTVGCCLIQHKSKSSRVISTLVKTTFDRTQKLAFGTHSVESDNNLRQEVERKKLAHEEGKQKRRNLPSPYHGCSSFVSPCSQSALHYVYLCTRQHPYGSAAVYLFRRAPSLATVMHFACTIVASHITTVGVRLQTRVHCSTTPSLNGVDICVLIVVRNRAYLFKRQKGKNRTCIKSVTAQNQFCFLSSRYHFFRFLL